MLTRPFGSITVRRRYIASVYAHNGRELWLNESEKQSARGDSWLAFELPLMTASSAVGL